eukprot:3935863-Rhodomonas_salina.3
MSSAGGVLSWHCTSQSLRGHVGLPGCHGTGCGAHQECRACEVEATASVTRSHAPQGQLSGWPGERVVIGLRVCKQLRRDLLVHCGSMAFVPQEKAIPSDFGLLEDFRRLPSNVMVTFKCRAKDQVTQLLGVLGGVQGAGSSGLEEQLGSCGGSVEAGRGAGGVQGAGSS